MVHDRYAELKAVQANRCPRALGGAVLLPGPYAVAGRCGWSRRGGGRVTLFPEEGRAGVTDPAILKSMDGRAYEGMDMSDLLGDGGHGDLDLAGGRLPLALGDDGQLHAVTVFESDKKLTARQLKSLVRFVHTQWQEGMGESFSNGLGDEHGLRLVFHLGETTTSQAGATLKRSPLLAAVALLRAGAPKPQGIAMMVIATEMSATFDLLLELGVDVNVVLPAGGPTAGSPLYWAANRGRRAMVERLLSAGADVNDQSPNGSSVLMVTRDPEIFECLLRAGADITLVETAPCGPSSRNTTQNRCPPGDDAGRPLPPSRRTRHAPRSSHERRCLRRRQPWRRSR